MRDVTIEDVTGEPLATAAANTSKVRNALTAATPRVVAPAVRNTSTNRQLAALPVEQHALEVAGNWSSSITARWSCTQRAYSGHRKGLCY